MAKVGRVSYFDDLFLYGLANPHKATIALFSTMNNQFTGFLMRLLVISLFHCFHIYLPTGRRKRGKCCINRPSAFAPSAFVRHARLWYLYVLMVSRADSSAVLTGQPWIYIDTHACARSLPHVHISSLVPTDNQSSHIFSLATGYEPGVNSTLSILFHSNSILFHQFYSTPSTLFHFISFIPIHQIYSIYTHAQPS